MFDPEMASVSRKTAWRRQFVSDIVIELRPIGDVWNVSHLVEAINSGIVALMASQSMRSLVSCRSKRVLRAELVRSVMSINAGHFALNTCWIWYLAGITSADVRES